MGSRGQAQILLGEFLRARRAERTPEDVGLPPDSRPRRVRGLRREEVARLANISADYYARLEQGRLPAPSLELLAAVGTALGLNGHDRVYMRELLSHDDVTAPITEVVTRQTSALIDGVVGMPVLVLGHLMDVLAWNSLATEFFIDFSRVPRQHRNLVRLLFLNEDVRSRFTDWSSAAQVAAGMLRMRAAHAPGDTHLTALVSELLELDDDFRRWWTGHHVLSHSTMRRGFRHPSVGEFEIEWAELTTSVQPDLAIIALTPADARSRQAFDQIRLAVAGTTDRDNAMTAVRD